MKLTVHLITANKPTRLIAEIGEWIGRCGWDGREGSGQMKCIEEEGETESGNNKICDTYEQMCGICYYLGNSRSYSGILRVSVSFIIK